MNDFYNDYEADICGSFQIYKENRREEIQEKLRLETEQKQAKLQAEALAKYEAEQAAEEAKRATEEAKGGKPAGKGKAAPAKKGGKDPGVPDLDVEQLAVPDVTEFKSEMENQYIRERPLQQIIDKLMTPQEEEEENKAEESKDVDESQADAKSSVADPKASALSGKKASVSKEKDAKNSSQTQLANATPEAVDGEGEGEQEEKEPEPVKFLENDYMEKAEMIPPKDPYGSDTMHADLILPNDGLYKIV